MPLNNEAALVDAQPDQDRLGGSQKLARLYTVIPAKNWQDTETYLTKTLPVQLADMPDRKIHFGLSVYGMHVPLKSLQKTTFAIKRALKASGKSVRIIPNKHLALSSAQVFHNNITDENGAEIVICKGNDNQLYIGKTIAVQNIDSYTARDQERPKRDAKVGMLPPKLAQIIINLATGPLPKRSSEDMSATPLTVLDPFCGTGVVLQEALLMGYKPYGTDIDQRMIEYSRQNLMWLDSTTSDTAQLELGDATEHTWEPKPDYVACETYLGRPFSSRPKQAELKKVMRDVDTIHKKFLQNLAAQTEPGFKICLAVPAWRDNNKFLRLPTLDSLEKLGYTRTSFAHAADNDLIYHRPDQIVGRELIVLTRK